MSRRSGWAALICAAALALAACGSSGSNSSTSTTHPEQSTTETTSASTGSTSSSVSSSASMVSASLAVATCPTTVAVSTTTTTALPSSETVSVPSGQAGHLVVFADTQGIMRLVAPKGWTCRANYGADGSGGLVITPPGAPVPANADAGWHPGSGSTIQAIVGYETGGSSVQGSALACALFSAAASATQQGLGQNCAHACAPRWRASVLSHRRRSPSRILPACREAGFRRVVATRRMASFSTSRRRRSHRPPSPRAPCRRPNMTFARPC